MYRARVTVSLVKGDCAAGYKEGDSFEFEDPLLKFPEGKGACIYAIANLIPYLTAFVRESEPEDWINRVVELQCADAKNTVVFRLERFHL